MLRAHIPGNSIAWIRPITPVLWAAPRSAGLTPPRTSKTALRHDIEVAQGGAAACPPDGAGPGQGECVAPLDAHSPTCTLDAVMTHA